MASPLTKRAQVFAFGSAGLAILSRKGRGKPAAPTVPQAKLANVAPYLSPCGRGYEGQLNAVKLWPKLVRGFIPEEITQ